MEIDIEKTNRNIISKHLKGKWVQYTQMIVIEYMKSHCTDFVKPLPAHIWILWCKVKTVLNLSCYLPEIFLLQDWSHFISCRKKDTRHSKVFPTLDLWFDISQHGHTALYLCKLKKILASNQLVAYRFLY